MKPENDGSTLLNPFGFAVDTDGDISLIDLNSIDDSVLDGARQQWSEFVPVSAESMICRGFGYATDRPGPLLRVEGLEVAWSPNPEQATAAKLNLTLTKTHLLGAIYKGAQVRWYDGKISEGPILKRESLAFSWPLDSIAELNVTIVRGWRRTMSNDELLVLGGAESALRIASVNLYDPPFAKDKSWTLSFAQSLGSAVADVRGSRPEWVVDAERGYEEHSTQLG